MDSMDGEAYFARAVSYNCKMFIELAKVLKWDLKTFLGSLETNPTLFR
jgi:hypothetical protein